MISPPSEMPYGNCSCGWLPGFYACVLTPGAIDHRAPGRFDDGPKSILHILRHFQLVVTPLEVEAQHRDPPFIHHHRIDLTVRVGVGNHFSSSGETNEVAIFAADVLLERRAIALMRIANSIERADARHMASPAKLDVVTTRKFILAIAPPPRHIHMHAADTIMVVRSHLSQLRKIPSHVAADRIRQIPPYDPGRIRQAVGELGGA